MSATVTDGETDGLGVISFQADEFKSVKAMRCDPYGKNVCISGPNGSGKTSATDSIYYALKGSGMKEITEPIRKGAKQARVLLVLGRDGIPEYHIERRVTEKSKSLVVTTADGSKVNKAQELLDGLLGRYARSPTTFLTQRPVDQVDAVLNLYGVEPPVAKVLEITGEDEQPRVGESASAYILRLSADDSGTYYLRRREANRTLELKAAALTEQQRIVDQLGGLLRPDEQPTSAAQLLGQLETLQVEADARREAVQAASEVANDHRDVLRQIEDRKRERAQLQAKETGLAAQIVELERQLRETREAGAALDERIAKGTKIAADLAAESASAESAASALPDPAPRIADIRRQLQTIEQSNVQRQKRQLAQDQLERLASEAAVAKSAHEHLDEMLTALRDLRAHLLDGLDLGVPGLQVGDGELRLNDVPFKQASQAEQIKVWAAISMRGDPPLKLLRLDDCEHIDRAGREALLRIANERGWQVIYTLVADTKELRVEIVEANHAA